MPGDPPGDPPQGFLGGGPSCGAVDSNGGGGEDFSHRRVAGNNKRGQLYDNIESVKCSKSHRAKILRSMGAGCGKWPMAH